MFRWFKERRNPGLKCERVGHDEKTEVRRGYTTSKWGVADQVYQTRQKCLRCGKGLTEWTEKDRITISNLTIDAEEWRILRQDGEIWERPYLAREQSQPTEA